MSRERFPSPFRSARRIRRDIDDEIAFHIEARIRALERDGLDPAHAREEALRRFGSVNETADACFALQARRNRRMRHRERLAAVKQDLVHSVRQLRRRPIFTLTATLTLAVGIGATTAVFSAADHVLLRPFPYAETERIVTLREIVRTDGTVRDVSPANLLSFAEHSTSFAVMGLAEPSGVSLDETTPPRSVPTWDVSEGFLSALGVTPRLGRVFEPEDFTRGSASVLLISEAFWRQHFDGDPRVVGRSLRVDGANAVIVGVLPDGMEYPAPKDLWQPKRFREQELNDRSSGYMDGVARLREGVSFSAAQADLDRISATLGLEHPSTNANLGVRMTPLRDHVLGPVRPALLALLGAVGLVLLIACVNVASLVLARGNERERELGVRAALGASRSRLMAQLITESVLLALVGGAFGVLLAYLGVDLLVALSPPELPRVDTIQLDGRVMGFALGVTLLAAVLFGLVPALRLSRPDLTESLGGGVRTGNTGVTRSRLRGIFVTTEIALALMLLVGAGLLLRSFVGLTRQDPGFAIDKRISMQMFIYDRTSGVEERIVRAHRLVEQFLAIPGIDGVGIVTSLPFHPSRIDSRDQMTIEGRPLPLDAQAPHVYTTVASPSYFPTMEIPVVSGRGFTEHDRLDSPLVAVVNETFARRYFPGESPIGERVTVGVMSRPYLREIVGVVGDVLPTALDSEPEPELFVPFAQSGTGSLTFVVHASADPAGVIPAMRRAVAEVDPRQSIYHAATLHDLVARTLAERRFNLALFTAFSGIALVLTVIGVYGLIRFSVSQRTSEIGIRVAVGAGRRQISSLIVGEAVRLALIGIAIGVGGALWLTRFIASMLVDTPPRDGWTFGVIVVLMLGASVLAAAIPARHAARIDPMLALRHE